MTQRRPSILIVNVEVDEADVDELNRWYEEEHGPEKLATPGHTSLRRFRAADGTARFLAIYELDNPEVATKPRPPGADSADRMRQIMDKWKRWSRDVWVEISSATAG